MALARMETHTKIRLNPNTHTARPTIRGTTRYWKVSIPCASRSRTSPEVFIVASSVVIAEALAPITRKVERKGATMRNRRIPTMRPRSSTSPV